MAEHEEQSGGVPPLDEEAAWAAIVAGYGQEPPDPPGARPFKPIENLLLPEEDVKPLPPDPKPEPEPEPKAGQDPEAEPEEPAPPVALGSSVTFAPGVGGAGPRDHSLAEPKEDDLTPEEEGHFVPPEPELPPADVTAKFAWLAVVGGPVLLLLAVLLQWDMTWWLTTLGIGGFLGGFATLVGRMAHDDDEDDDPGRGAVV
ncbi:hypothetical protein ACLF6K_30400 [Streptomyces xanthophaeus]|uniref:hypothetical protein n=1 Tax=Streptomyces xanthophaeus TaxID=67385 RepID=UPI00398FF4AB